MSDDRALAMGLGRDSTVRRLASGILHLVARVLMQVLRLSAEVIDTRLHPHENAQVRYQGSIGHGGRQSRTYQGFS
jgi:hypothetical protein